MSIFKRKSVDMARVPKHVAFIMDGNGRWAKKRGLVRTAGHVEGAKRVQDLARNAKEFGIKVVTLYTFSTENWKRPKEEIDYIFNLGKKFLIEGKEDFMKNNVRVYFIGKIDELDEDFRKLIYETMEESEEEKRVKAKEKEMDDLIDQMAKMIIEENESIIGKDIAEKAKEKVTKRGRKPKKVTEEKEGKDEKK